MSALAVKPQLASRQKTSFDAIRLIEVARLITDPPQEKDAANDDLAAERLEDGVNTYSYVRNNPINYTDPTGTQALNNGT